MNRNEITKLLEILCDHYGNAKIGDPSVVASTWELTLGNYSAEAIYKAARLRMASSRWMPEPSDLIDLIPRAELVYKEKTTKAIEAGMKKDAEKWGPFLDAFCRKMGFGCEPDDEIDLRKFLPEGEKLPTFLDYEQ